MKKITATCLSLTMLCLALIAVSAHAEDASELSEKESFVKYYSYFQGTWKVAVTKEGQTETEMVKVRGSEGGCNIVTKKDFTAIWGYNPKSGQWAGVWQMEDGSRATLWISKPKDDKIGPGTQFKISGSTNHADGSVTQEVATFTCIDHNHYEIKITPKTKDGKALPEITRVATRVNCQPTRKRLRLRR